MVLRNNPGRRLAAMLLTAMVCTSAVSAATDAPEWAAPFAEHLYDAWRTGTPMPQLSAAQPEATLDEAYRVQRLFIERMLEGDSLGGFKAAGVANPDDDFPLIAVMPGSGVLYASDAVVIDLSEDPHRHVENEIGFIFNKPIAAPLPDIETLHRHVGAIVAIVEVPGNPVEDALPVTSGDLVAWNINGKDMILGEPHDPDAIDPDAIEITFTRDGETINEARGDMAAGGQWHTLLKTVNHIVRQGYALEPGHIITNGALNLILKAEPGRYRADYGPLGIIEFEVRP